MDEHRLTQLFRLTSHEVSERTRFCPDDESVAQYFDGTLNDQMRFSLKHHLIDCRFCMARVGNLERLAAEDNACRVPGTVLADAKGLARQSLPTERKRHAPVWATAALVVLTLSAITMLGIRPGEDSAALSPGTQQTPELSRQFRSIDPVAHRPSIISPVDGVSIGSDELVIRWTGVSGSLHYDVRVVDAEGFIIHRDRVQGATDWKPPSGLLFEPGMAYYVRIDAYLAEANIVSSEHVLFTVSGLRQ